MSNEAATAPGPRAGRGEIFIVSAPSGAGKSTLVRRLLAEPSLAGSIAFSVSHTTRAPRSGEGHGEHYYFVGREEFERTVRAGGFLEHAEVHGRLYGTSRAEVFGRLERGVDVVLDIDVQGARQVLASCPEAQAIFILPPSFAELRRRLEGRRSEAPEQVERRLRTAAEEVHAYDEYRYVIINDDVERAARSLVAIVASRRQRRARLEAEIAGVLRDFPQPPR